MSLCLAEALMVVPSGANSRPLFPSELCGPVPKYEFRVEGGIFKMKGGNEDGAVHNLRGPARCRIHVFTASGQSSAISDATSPVKLEGKTAHVRYTIKPVNTDTEGAIESVRINRGFVLSGLNLEKIQGLSFLKVEANCPYSCLSPLFVSYF